MQWSSVFLALTHRFDLELLKCHHIDGLVTRAAYRYMIRSRYRYYPIPIHGIEMTHSKRYSKSILTSSIWEKSNNNLTKYHPAYQKIPVYSNKIRKFDMWTLPWQALWQFLLHIIIAQAVAVGCVWCSWWQFSTFQCRITSLWIIWLCGYRDMDRIDIGIEMWYQYWYRYRKICNNMQPALPSDFIGLKFCAMPFNWFYQNKTRIKLYWGWVMHICVSKLGHHWFR